MVFDLNQITIGLLLSTAVGGLAYWRQSLTAGGWFGAVITGTATLGFGGWAWGFTLIAFFVSSSVLSHYKERLKEQRAAEKFSKGGRRDLVQAMANGGIGALIALLYALLGAPEWLLGVFVGVMATVTADTWATELGVLSPHRPRLITNGQPVEPGTSGGISLMGTSAAAAGGLMIGLVMFIGLSLGQWLSGEPLSLPWWLLPGALLGGLGGAMVDSLLGATVQAIYRYPSGKETERTVGRDGTPNAFVRGWRWMNNDMVNLLSSLAGGAITVLIYWLLGA
ncbi:DUF92 domain-containing protein [Candidatus Viridilinea mediisalina]|uniref:DUF92 domain-containing protein n=1 Tax=Candidatus Viridilinea mediisalina TaxID=2024553 RepID=A0A2A6RH69_9CHLR|nr:DUF92 domain-containing protein [Candidatus Viridilinea mediisalina]PDW02225.1 hypothetical protein CJ255_15020 [Candidatus Viridilinea mediisalina]